MAKILLKHPGNKSHKNYQKNIAKIAKVAIESRSASTPKIQMISAKELSANKKIVMD